MRIFGKLKGWLGGWCHAQNFTNHLLTTQKWESSTIPPSMKIKLFVIPSYICQISLNLTTNFSPPPRKFLFCLDFFFLFYSIWCRRTAKIDFCFSLEGWAEGNLKTVFNSWLGECRPNQQKNSFRHLHMSQRFKREENPAHKLNELPSVHLDIAGKSSTMKIRWVTTWNVGRSSTQFVDTQS